MRNLARFMEPCGDKHYSFQMIGKIPEQWELLKAMQIKDVKDVKPFLQGYSKDWCMVEFWTKDRDSAVKAAESIASYLKVEIGYGDFTRDDLGL